MHLRNRQRQAPNKIRRLSETHSSKARDMRKARNVARNAKRYNETEA